MSPRLIIIRRVVFVVIAIWDALFHSSQTAGTLVAHMLIKLPTNGVSASALLAQFRYPPPPKGYMVWQSFDLNRTKCSRLHGSDHSTEGPLRRRFSASDGHTRVVFASQIRFVSCSFVFIVPRFSLISSASANALTMWLWTLQQRPLRILPHGADAVALALRTIAPHNYLPAGLPCYPSVARGTMCTVMSRLPFDTPGNRHLLKRDLIRTPPPM